MMPSSTPNVSVTPPLAIDHSIELPILCYHRIVPDGAQDSVWSLGVSAFQKQLERLRNGGYQSISMHTLTESRAGRATLPPKPILLTFDDGDERLPNYAAPLLLQYGFSATFFVVAGELGNTLRLDGGPPLQILSRRAVIDLSQQGFEIQSHGLRHSDWTMLNDKLLQKELVDSAAILEDLTGIAVRYLAYPYGQWSRKVRDRAERVGYLGGCTTLPGRNGSNTDMLLLRRTLVLNRKGRSFLPWARYQAGLRIKRLFGVDRKQ